MDNFIAREIFGLLFVAFGYTFLAGVALLVLVAIVRSLLRGD